MPFTAEALEATLTMDGWPFERLDATTWRSGFQAPDQEKIRFFVRLTDDWLFLTVIPIVRMPALDTVALTLTRRLLELNRTMTLAKFAIDAHEIVLTVELPTVGLIPPQIIDGLNALSLYAVTHCQEVLDLAAAAPPRPSPN